MKCNTLKHYITAFLEKNLSNMKKVRLVEQLQKIVLTETDISDDRCEELNSSLYFIMYMED
ncbi:MAG: hypothetical protein DRH57_09335 [Candidatus Cloacimonadota bacterium]|nr:MAG: hypothetical protein DRH57_09335 [Candidatus Cloacimonadota bacterium]